jgi:hypothetical protein
MKMNTSLEAVCGEREGSRAQSSSENEHEL